MLYFLTIQVENLLSEMAMNKMKSVILHQKRASLAVLKCLTKTYHVK